MTTPGAPSRGGEPAKQPTTQEKLDYRQYWPAWAKQLPRLRFAGEPDKNYQLIDPVKLEALLAQADPASKARILADMEFMKHELMRLFRQRDFEASKQQNRYRLYQIAFMGLASLATLVGSFQALSLNSNPDIVPLFALLETILALLTTYLATISGREAPLPLWLQNRRRAEYLRREYFRYLMQTAPYNIEDDTERKLLLSKRAANINRGDYPDKQMDN
jgi:hypothetical protein